MTPKEKILAFVERMPDDVTLDLVFYKLELFIGVETGFSKRIGERELTTMNCLMNC